MRLNENQDIRRVRVLALGTGLVAAVLGTLLLAFLPSSPSAAPAVRTDERRRAASNGHAARRRGPADDEGDVVRHAADRLLRSAGSAATAVVRRTRRTAPGSRTRRIRRTSRAKRTRASACASQVRASNAEGADTATSNPTAVIQSARRPANVTEPTISGTPTRGLAADREPRHVGRRGADHVLVPVAPLQHGGRQLQRDQRRDGQPVPRRRQRLGPDAPRAGHCPERRRLAVGAVEPDQRRGWRRVAAAAAGQLGLGRRR